MLSNRSSLPHVITFENDFEKICVFPSASYTVLVFQEMSSSILPPNLRFTLFFIRAVVVVIDPPTMTGREIIIAEVVLAPAIVGQNGPTLPQIRQGVVKDTDQTGTVIIRNKGEVAIPLQCLT